MGRRKGRVRFFAVLVTLLAVWGFLGLRGRLRPVVRSLAKTQVINTASDLINDAILRQIMEGQIQYFSRATDSETTRRVRQGGGAARTLREVLRWRVVCLKWR